MSDTELTYSADHVQRLLQCSVCLDRYRQPKLLPCQHTFCLRPCLEGLVSFRTRMLRCPECRADHLVPRGGPAHFPNNLTIISFLELPRRGGGGADGGGGGGEGGSGDGGRGTTERSNADASAFSNRAATNGGSDDANATSTAGGRSNAASDRAERFPLAYRGAGGGREGVEGGPMGGGGGGASCSACHTEGHLSRCSHCDQLLCDLCKRAHMDMVRSDVNRFVGQLRRSLPQITEQINGMSRKGVQVQNLCENIKAEVAEVIDKHIRELKIRERLLNDDVDSFLVGELRNLRSHQENLEMELASMASFCDTSEATLSRARHLTNGDLVELRNQCLENMSTLRDYENGVLRPPVPRNIQLAAESQFLSTTISNFGDLIFTSGSTSLIGGSAVVGAAAAAGSTGAAHEIGVSGERRRTTLRAPETATDYALSVLGTRSPSLSPAILRRRLSPPPRGSVPVVNFPDEELYEDEEPEEEDEDDRPLPRRLEPRRRLRTDRRDRRSETPLASLLERGGMLLNPFRRSLFRRHQSLGAVTPTNDSSDQSESSPEPQGVMIPGIARRSFPPRRRTFTGNPLEEEDDEDEMEIVGIGRAPALTYPPRRSARSSLRFDVPPDTSSETEDTPVPPRGARRGGDDSGLRGDNTSPSVYVTTPRNRYNQKGQAMIRFGERGTDPEQFSWPRGVAVSPLDDNIFVADSSNHRVQIFDNTGRYIRTFGDYGSSDGGFDCLAGITVNGLGQIIIADRYNHRIQIFDRSCSFQRAFGSEGSNDGQLSYPWGVACDNMGFIYVCDKENHRVQVYQSNGDFVRNFGRLGSNVGTFDNPHYLAISPDNKVYVSDSSNHRVQVFSIYGDFLFSFGSCGSLRGQMKFPRGIAIDNQGFVVVADSGNNRVQIFRADGRYYSMFGSWGSESGQFKGLEGLAILANGNVVVTDRENHRIQVF